ncbi:MAG TPA: DNA gyrase modulator, partial [Marmoricola sp.]
MAAVTPQSLVEHALATSTSDHCVVIAQDSTSANLRWANNTLTTNGVMHSIGLTVIAFHGAGNASVSGTAASPDQATALVAQADAAARAARPAEDRAELVVGTTAPDWDDPPAETSIEVYRGFAGELGEEFERAERDGRILYGFVNHEITTTYVGSSTGLRLRHVQPTGHYGCTGKSADLGNSAWVGGATRDFADLSAHQLAVELESRLGWA